MKYFFKNFHIHLQFLKLFCQFKTSHITHIMWMSLSFDRDFFCILMKWVPSKSFIFFLLSRNIFMNNLSLLFIWCCKSKHRQMIMITCLKKTETFRFVKNISTYKKIKVLFSLRKLDFSLRVHRRESRRKI